MAADPIVAPPRPRAPQRPRLRPAPPPRRVSGPVAPARTGRPRTARATAGGAVALPAPTRLPRALELLRGLPDSKLLDRLLRGQGWVVLIGIALMGIVALQVSLLKMNAGIGQSIERGAQLERHNADLRAEVSRLSSEERIAKVAGELGLVMPDAGHVRYVQVRGERDAQKAADVMRAPDPVDELASTTSASVAPATPAAATTTTTAPASGTTATAPPATTTPPAETAPAAPTTPTEATPATGTTAGATPAPAGTTPAPGQ